ncbi:Retrovirus-related Pol poly from transposon [Paramuricea clavata]|uniref:Retrovirus-related Pol poly from transposon n=1 Tax=Paramuricea clavata TaxID=317549 RepID=A0A7D9IEN9_PARCT|nr:Retrovirus-related Pol poly from transposon [Paramuricea clavata]
MLLRLQPYSLTIKYRQGADMEIADVLSRLSLQETEPISDMDPEIKELNDVVYNGWPTNIKQVQEILKPYWTFRDEITTEDDGAEYLLIADYYSTYQFVREVPKGKSSSRTIANLTKETFSEQGIPKIVRSDNGPHFEGQAYKEFAKQYRFQHITSSPHYPRSNGFIES